MAEENPKCFEGSSFSGNDQNPFEKSAMEAKTKKAKLSRASPDDDKKEDRLSALPDCILCHILSFLPTKFAASTSILSTRWRYVFFHGPKIDLDDSLLIHPRTSVNVDDNLLELEKKFIDFVYRLLMNCESTSVVSEFRLRCQKLGSRIFVLSSWISSLLSRNVQVLDVWVDNYIYRLRGVEVFPSAIFACKTLVVLKLGGDVSLRLPKSICLPNVKVLHLKDFRLLGDNTGWALTSSCPLLDDFRIDDIKFCDVGLVDISSPFLTKLVWNPGLLDDKVVFNTPNLESLEYQSDVSQLISSNCKLKSLLKANLTLEIDDAPNERDALQFCQFIGEMCNLEFLCLFGDSLEFLYEAYHPLPELFNLTHLELSSTWNGYWEYLEILLKSAPNLKVLVCDLGQVETYDGMQLHFSAKEKPLCLNQHLREVEIKKFSGISNEFDLVRYLLKHGAVLQQMSIYADRTEMPPDWCSSVSKRLNKFSKCSKNCNILVI